MHSAHLPCLFSDSKQASCGSGSSVSSSSRSSSIQRVNCAASSIWAKRGHGMLAAHASPQRLCCMLTTILPIVCSEGRAGIASAALVCRLFSGVCFFKSDLWRRQQWLQCISSRFLMRGVRTTALEDSPRSPCLHQGHRIWPISILQASHLEWLVELGTGPLYGYCAI